MKFTVLTALWHMFNRASTRGNFGCDFCPADEFCSSTDVPFATSCVGVGGKLSSGVNPLGTPPVIAIGWRVKFKMMLQKHKGEILQGKERKIREKKKI